MTTIVLDKKNFGNIMWNLYNMIQEKPKNGLVITIDEDVERIWETTKNRNSNPSSNYKNKKQIFVEAMDGYNNWNAIDWKSFLSNLISKKSNV